MTGQKLVIYYDYSNNNSEIQYHNKSLDVLKTDQLNAINSEDPESTYMTDDEEEIVENEETELCLIKLFLI
jgi:hypothetical protein